MVAAPFRATHAAPARRARPRAGEGQVEHVVQRVPARRGGVVDRLLDDASSLPPSCRGRTRAVGSVVRRAHAPRGDTLHTCRRLLGQPLGGRHGAQPRARRAARGRSALPLLQRHQPRAGVSSGISLLSRTTNRSATWSDPLRPVHRQDVGACELPMGGSSNTVAVAMRQGEQRPRRAGGPLLPGESSTRRADAAR